MIKARHANKRSVLVILLLLALLCLLGAQYLALSGRRARTEAQLGYVAAAAREFDVPAAMVLSVIRVESDFRPNAVSSAGACGLMQLMPETFADLQTLFFHEALQERDVFDPAVNIRYGTCYLSYLFEKFGCWETALAAYNAGEGRVAAWLRDPALAQNGRLKRIPFAETADYVEEVLSLLPRYERLYRNMF